MDEIGNRADVARTTVFNYYPKKSAFLDEWAARRRAKVADSLRQHHLDDKPIGVVLENYMLLFAQLNEEHRTEATELMPAAITFGNVLNDPPLAETVADYIRLAQERGQVWAEVDAGQAGLMLAMTYFATLTSWCAHEPPSFDLGEALTSAARLMLHGLAADRG